jgi:hypothetical protein
LATPHLQDFVKKIEGETLGPWLFKEEIILFNSQIYLLPTSDFIIFIVKESHSSTHKGLINFYWFPVFLVFNAKNPTRIE